MNKKTMNIIKIAMLLSWNHNKSKLTKALPYVVLLSLCLSIWALPVQNFSWTGELSAMSKWLIRLILTLILLGTILTISFKNTFLYKHKIENPEKLSNEELGTVLHKRENL